MLKLNRRKNLNIDSIGFPVACKKHKNHEYEISIAEYGDEHVYLVDSTTGIHSIRRNEEKIFLTSQEKKSQEWNIYSIRAGKEGRSQAIPTRLWKIYARMGLQNGISVSAR